MFLNSTKCMFSSTNGSFLLCATGRFHAGQIVDFRVRRMYQVGKLAQLFIVFALTWAPLGFILLMGALK